MPSRKEIQIRRAIQEFVQSSLQEGKRVVVTGKARQVITTTLLAIVDDPSPDWFASRSQLRDTQEEMIKRLPDLLSEVASNDGRIDAVSPRVDTFSLLHAMSGLLDRICPFDKAGRPLRGPKKLG